MVFNALPPSVFLPQIKGIRTCSRRDLADAVARLREIYIHPHVRGSTRRRPPGDSLPRLPHSAKLSEQDIALLNADPFERSFAIQWLTRFISTSSELEFESEDAVVWGVDVLEQASSLLAVCAGAAASGTVERVFVFPFTLLDSSHSNTGDFATDPGTTLVLNDCQGCIQHDSEDIRVVLRDAPLESADFSSVGAQTWGGSCVLAEMIAERPEDFGILRNAVLDGTSIRHFRALELGAGTGLASLVLAKVLERVRGLDTRSGGLQPAMERESDTVVATDFHPSVLANLKGNIEINFPSAVGDVPAASLQPFDSGAQPHPSCLSSGVHVVALPLDWSLIHGLSRSDAHPLDFNPNTNSLFMSNSDMEIPASTAHSLPPLDAPFDLIIGADIIYEPLHAQWVRSCVELFLRKPNATDAPAVFHLIIPLRRTHSLESRTVEEVFVPAPEILAARKVDAVSGDNGIECHPSGVVDPVLALLSREDIVCDAYLDTGEAEEVVYRYYKIGWV